jgi:acyl CoA:acetate/3-ketoacid CoA transferase alpha subunit/acyl CoA:acetate/3-ketoacid CoA transferase beta subunit
MTGGPHDPGERDVVTSLDEAVGHVRAGDAVHVLCSHTRFSAAARALVRRWWGRDPGWTLVMLSLSSLGALFFPPAEGEPGLVRKVVTGYSGDVFPNFTPNPRFSRAYLAGEVEVEHWSFLAFAQRMQAAARGLPAVTTRSLAGSSMAANPGYAELDSPFGRLGLLEAYAPDIAVVHAAVSDRAGNLAFHPPLLEGLGGALAARRGVVASVERVVDDITPWAHLVQVPAHRVLAVAEAPMGAHPGGLYGSFTPAEPYGEDLAFWVESRDATRAGDDRWAEFVRHWVLEPETQPDYLDRLGPQRVARLRARADRGSWREDAAAHPVDEDAPANDWELATVHGARSLADRLVATGADAVLAGAGVANLATWLAVEQARGRGAPTVLTAELGLLGYEPTPADPFVFNHRAFPSATMLSDAEAVLGGLVPGPGTRCLACLGAAQVDAAGNINSTEVPGAVFLVGSGGGNDVASAADDIVVVTTLTARRTVPEVPYITSPGERVSVLATDLGVFERRGGGFVLVGVPAGVGREEHLERLAEVLAWPLEVAEDCAELAPPTAEELRRLRTWDPEGLFLRA